MADLHTQFDIAAQEAKELTKKPDNQTLLILYGLYKQATAGDTTGKRPGFADPVGQAKYDSWNKLKGTSTDSAMKMYIELVSRLKAK